MADKPTVIKVSGKKKGKNDKFTIDEKEHPQLFAARPKNAPKWVP